jgi:hypothetical protein
VFPGAAGRLPGHFLFTSYRGYNPLMSSSNWIKIIGALVIGAGIGIIYGWVIDPIEYTDVTPGILREDYRADYVLMVAEAFHTEYDADAAARRLAVLGSEPPSQILSSTLDYARVHGFTPQEIALLQELLSAMQTFSPETGGAP